MYLCFWKYVLIIYLKIKKHVLIFGKMGINVFAFYVIMEKLVKKKSLWKNVYYLIYFSYYFIITIFYLLNVISCFNFIGFNYIKIKLKQYHACL
jgi:hypothetical protein